VRPGWEATGWEGEALPAIELPALLRWFGTKNSPAAARRSNAAMASSLT
jgi:hypothetical protein